MDSRRVVDLALGSVALVVAAPLLVAAACAIRLSGDDGPLLYRSPRVGEHGRVFMMLKMRTMTHRAEGPAITVASDPRVTRVGQALRRFRIDELPQIINVLRGEMSLVGPRPEHPEFVDFSDPVHRRVFTVRPGITGLAQLAFHDEAEMLTGPDVDKIYREEIQPSKLRLDCKYLDNRSVWLDIRIMTSTLLAVIH